MYFICQLGWEIIVQLLEVAAISQRVKFLPFAISQQLLAIGLRLCSKLGPSWLECLLFRQFTEALSCRFGPKRSALCGRVLTNFVPRSEPLCALCTSSLKWRIKVPIWPRVRRMQPRERNGRVAKNKRRCVNFNRQSRLASNECCMQLRSGLKLWSFAVPVHRYFALQNNIVFSPQYFNYPFSHGLSVHICATFFWTYHDIRYIWARL